MKPGRAAGLLIAGLFAGGARAEAPHISQSASIMLRIASAGGKAPRDVVVVPIKDEAELRNLAWIEDDRRTVDRLSGGRLAYVYLPDTGKDGFKAFNRAYFAQTDKQGAIIDERFNAGG